MNYTKYYFATGNKQKLERLKKIFAYINPSIEIQRVPDLVDVEENWITAEENAFQKIEPYIWKYDFPILAEDTAVFFEWIDFDPTKVKRETLESAWLEEKNISQEQVFQTMLDYYKNLATSKWWEFIFHYVDWWAITYPDSTSKTFSYKRKYIMTNISVWEPQLYFPMCNLYKSQITWKHYMDWNEGDYKKEFQIQVKTLKKELNF